MSALEDIAAAEAALVLLGRGRLVGPTGAIASKFLAVGTPRSIGLIGCGPDAGALLAAHRAIFPAPRDVRCADADPARAAQFARDHGGRVTTVEEACACDIVCTTAPVELQAAWIRRGTHVNAMAGLAAIDPELVRFARVVGRAELGKICAGIIDGRELDEITLFDGAC